MQLILIIINILIGIFTAVFLIRMFVSRRDAYSFPIFISIFRATDPIMAQVHRVFKRKPADTETGDFTAIIPIVALIVLQGISIGIFVADVSILEGVTGSFQSFFDSAFLVYTIIIITFSVFYKHSRYSANPIVRTGFKIMEPVYVFIGKYFPPLKKYPGATAFAIGFLIHAILIATLLIIEDSVLLHTPLKLVLIGFTQTLENVFFLFTFFMWVVIIGALLSWVSPDPNNPIVQTIYMIAETLNKPFRKIIPTIGGISISPIFTILALQAAAYASRFLISTIFSLFRLGTN